MFTDAVKCLNFSFGIGTIINIFQNLSWNDCVWLKDKYYEKSLICTSTKML